MSTQFKTSDFGIRFEVTCDCNYTKGDRAGEVEHLSYDFPSHNSAAKWIKVISGDDNFNNKEFTNFTMKPVMVKKKRAV